jgi:flagellar hook assembly protein FlgD
VQIYGGWRGRVAALAVAGVTCGVLGAPAAYADAPVEPPTITTPTDGSPAAGDLTVSALAPAGATHVQFNIGILGAYVDVTDGVATTTLSTYQLANGDNLLTAVGCNADGCGSLSAEPVSVLVQNPAITAVSYSPFSPNGDGRRETVSVSYSLPAESTVTFSVRDALGAEVYATAAVVRPAGTTTVVWNGKNTAGTVVPHGRYTARIDTTRSVGDPAAPTVLSAYATRSVVVDKIAPYLTSPSGAKTTFFPYREGYRDYFQPAITTNETATLWLRIYTSGGKLVRTLSLGTKAKGRHSGSWNGRLASGTKLPAGTYLFAWIARDVAGNQRTTGKSSFKLSWQKAVLRSTSKTVTAAASRYSTVVGSCSLVRTASEVASGALELRSNGKEQDGVACDSSTSTFDLASTRHRLLVSVREYKSLKVTVYGSDAYGFGTGTLSVHNPSGSVAASRSLPKDLGSYAAPVVGAAAVDRYGYLRWRMTTRQGHSWAPRKFTVAYSWWVRV